MSASDRRRADRSTSLSVKRLRRSVTCGDRGERARRRSPRSGSSRGRAPRAGARRPRSPSRDGRTTAAGRGTARRCRAPRSGAAARVKPTTSTSTLSAMSVAGPLKKSISASCGATRNDTIVRRSRASTSAARIDSALVAHQDRGALAARARRRDLDRLGRGAALGAPPRPRPGSPRSRASTRCSSSPDDAARARRRLRTRRATSASAARASSGLVRAFAALSPSAASSRAACRRRRCALASPARRARGGRRGAGARGARGGAANSLARARRRRARAAARSTSRSARLASGSLVERWLATRARSRSASSSGSCAARRRRRAIGRAPRSAAVGVHRRARPSRRTRGCRRAAPRAGVAGARSPPRRSRSRARRPRTRRAPRRSPASLVDRGRPGARALGSRAPARLAELAPIGPASSSRISRASVSIRRRETNRRGEPLAPGVQIVALEVEQVPARDERRARRRARVIARITPTTGRPSMSTPTQSSVSLAVAAPRQPARGHARVRLVGGSARSRSRARRLALEQARVLREPRRSTRAARRPSAGSSPRVTCTLRCSGERRSRRRSPSPSPQTRATRSPRTNTRCSAPAGWTAPRRVTRGRALDHAQHARRGAIALPPSSDGSARGGMLSSAKVSRSSARRGSVEQMHGWDRARRRARPPRACASEKNGAAIIHLVQAARSPARRARDARPAEQVEAVAAARDERDRAIALAARGAERVTSVGDARRGSRARGPRAAPSPRRSRSLLEQPRPPPPPRPNQRPAPQPRFLKPFPPASRAVHPPRTTARCAPPRLPPAASVALEAATRRSSASLSTAGRHA